MTACPPSRPISLRFALPAVLLAAVLAGCGPQAAEQTASAPTVTAAVAVLKDVRQWDTFNGRVEAVQSVALRPRVLGYIEKVAFTEGKEVKKGDVLFSIDARSHRAELDRAVAELARARTQADLAQAEAERAQKLNQQKAVSTETWEQRRAAAEQALANVQAAQAAAAQARLNLEWTQVRAPIDGRAGRALVTAGNLVTTGDGATVLTTIVSQDKVYVYFDVDEATYLRYAQMTRRGERAGDLPVHVGLVGEEKYPHTGKLDFLDNQMVRSTGTIGVRATLDNTDRIFTPGLFARVQLPGSGEFQAVLIDEKAVLTDQDRKYVYVVDKDSKAQRRDVQLGRTAEGLRIVQKGLAAGDRVIVDGVQKVSASGMVVDAKPAEVATAALETAPALN